MDYSKIITELLGIQDVEIEDIKRFKADLRVEIIVRQKGNVPKVVEIKKGALHNDLT